jgi:hypothetical protein
VTIGPKDIIEGSIAFSRAQAAAPYDPRCCIYRKRGSRYFALDGANVRILDLRYDNYKRCPSYRDCIGEKVQVPAGLLEGPFRKPRSLGDALPKFVPIVNPKDPRTYAHCRIPGLFPSVIVQTGAFLTGKDKIDRLSASALRETLGFNGRLILSSIMLDRVILKRKVEDYIEMVAALEPDAVITWDVPTYSDHPYAATFNWMLRGLDAARKMALKLDIPLIGLVSGSDLEQVRISSRSLAKMGFSGQALACRELAIGRRFKTIASYAEEVKRNAQSLLMIGCSSPSAFWRFPMADSFAGLAWFYDSVFGRSLAGADGRSRRPSYRSNSQDNLAKENLLACHDLAEGNHCGLLEAA